MCVKVIKQGNTFVMGNVGDVEAHIVREQLDDTKAIDFHQDINEGNILRIGGSIYFLKHWPDDLLFNGYRTIQKALSEEIISRGGELSDIVCNHCGKVVDLGDKG